MQFSKHTLRVTCDDDVLWYNVEQGPGGALKHVRLIGEGESASLEVLPVGAVQAVDCLRRVEIGGLDDESIAFGPPSRRTGSWLRRPSWRPITLRSCTRR